MKLEKKNILIISNEPWGDIWFSKHNYAYELSKKNKVFFINPTSGWTFLNLFRRNVEIRKEQENIYSLNYNNFLPHYFLKLNNRIVSARIRKKLNATGIHKTFFWSFDPSRLFLPQLLNAEYSLFEAVDKYRFSLKGEKILYSNVNAIIVISEDFRKFHEPFGKPVLTVSHAVSSEEFNIQTPAPVQPLTDQSCALYVGNLDYRLDYKLIRKMAEKFPQIRFVFIGGITITDDPDFVELFLHKKIPNVIYEGKKHFKELKYHIAASGFCIAPMRRFEGNTISHHKIFQYLALGKPVFSCEFSEYKKSGHLLYMENDPSRLIEKMDRFISHGEPDDIQQERVALAKQFSFESIFSKIETFISENQ